MDKDKIIKSLQSIIDELNSIINELSRSDKLSGSDKSRYEARWWNFKLNSEYPIRPLSPDETSYDLESIIRNITSLFKHWKNIEVYDTHERRVIMKYEESI